MSNGLLDSAIVHADGVAVLNNLDYQEFVLVFGLRLFR